MTTTLLRKTFAPRGAARDIFHLRAPEVLIVGSAGTGKSRACLEKLNAVAWKYPGMRGLIVRKVARSLTNTVLAAFRQHVITDYLASGEVQWYGGSAQEPAQYRYSNGSSIQVAGMDQASRIMSSEYDFIYVAEATEITENDCELLATRLRNGVMPYQQLLMDCNPQHPTHWLKVRCDKGQCVILNSQPEENPIYFDADGNLTEKGQAYISKLDNLTGVRYQRLRKGLWVGAEGIIFDEFDPSIHVIDEMPDGWETWTRYWTVDFGHTHPFVLQCWAEDGDGRLYLYREIYHTKKLVEDHARTILSLVVKDGEWLEPKPFRIICDHDAEGRATFSKHAGLGTHPAKKAVTDGIEKVQVRLRRQTDGKPRIFFLKNALVSRDQALVDAKKPTCTVESILSYIWAPDKEQPVKEDDDGADAMRYMVADRDLGGTFRMRSIG
jgi:PBSX family phage terminase large subunit